MYKVLIVEDEPLVQVGIKSMLNCEKFGLEICGMASNGETALELIRKQDVDIVICDIKMPKLDGLGLIKICCEEFGYGKPAFIFLTSFDELPYVKEALAYHASDYLIKLELTPSLLDAALKKAIQTLPEKEPEPVRLAEADIVLNYKEKFYIRLLQNLIADKEQLTTQSGLLEIRLDADAYSCVYASFTGPNDASLSAKKQLSLYVSALELLRELLSRYFRAEVVSLDIRHFAVIIFQYREKGAGLTPSKDTILETLRALDDNLHKYYNLRFYAGVGAPVNAAPEISVSYQNARHAHLYTDGQESILHADDCEDLYSGQRQFNLAIIKDNLSQAFDEFDEEKLSRVIDEICAVFKDHPGHTVQALDAACSFLYIAISSIPGGEQTMTELFSEYPDHYLSIYRQTTMEQVVSWLKIFKEKLCGYFLQRKNSHTNLTVSRVKLYIQEHVSEKLSLNEVADQFYISPNYLSQLFKKYNDMGFSEYISFCKIREAKRLMQQGKLKVYEISDALGFENSFYFSKVFKKVEGISPTEYMKLKVPSQSSSKD